MKIQKRVGSQCYDVLGDSGISFGMLFIKGEPTGEYLDD